MFAERRDRHALGGRVERCDHFITLFGGALQLIEDRLQVVGGLAGQLLIAIALQSGAAEVGEGVADRMSKLRAERVGSFVDPFGAAHAAGRTSSCR